MAITEKNKFHVFSNCTDFACATQLCAGPAWANSLFEDNAEFGFGMRKALCPLEFRAFHITFAPGLSKRQGLFLYKCVEIVLPLLVVL